MERARRHHQAVADVLGKLVLVGMRFVFDTAAQIFQPQPWVVGVDGKLLGHLLTVDDTVFDQVLGESLVEVLTFPEAFDREWDDLEQRRAWVELYADALVRLAEFEKGRDRVIREQKALGEAIRVEEE